jgi:hypothetical protein
LAMMMVTILITKIRRVKDPPWGRLFLR